MKEVSSPQQKEMEKAVAEAVVIPTPVKNSGFNIDKLAYAVAMHETGNCKLGYGKQYNNCFGIKSGNTAPCKKIGNKRMCVYNTPEESYIAFKIIRERWYKGMPNLAKAKRWSGNDRAQAWLNNVTATYNK